MAIATKPPDLSSTIRTNSDLSYKPLVLENNYKLKTQTQDNNRQCLPYKIPVNIYNLKYPRMHVLCFYT